MKSYFKTISLLAVFIINGLLHLNAQNNITGLSTVVINQDEFTVKAGVLNDKVKINLCNVKSYKWYQAQKIMETKGGFSGKLLHGEYKEYYLNDQLKEKGFYKYGLKNKEWKYWYADGKLRETITWKKGLRQGKYQLYNDYGQLVATGKFKNDKLHGKFFTYGNGGKIIEEKVYKNGEEVLPILPIEKKEHEVVKNNN
jgi:antitoxin component YwqK of YwqJK toxin-antitoxin module